MANIELTEADNEKTISAKKDDIVTISLRSNPSTGFFWQSLDSTAGTLQQAQHDSYANPKPGESVMVRFAFKIEKTGNLHLSYARPWAGLTPPEKWYTVFITVS